MDDLVQYVLEQIAFDGVLGTTTERMWSFTEEFFGKREQVQNLDQQYKTYLWTTLSSCDDFVIAVQGTDQSHLEILKKDASSLIDLEERYKDNLRVSTTEERQWMALTGHEINHQEVGSVNHLRRIVHVLTDTDTCYGICLSFGNLKYRVKGDHTARSI